MTCRATTSAQTCSGTPTGQAMTYDALRRMVTWASDSSGFPATSTSSVYDGEGERVQQSTNSRGTTRTTSYFVAYEEVTVATGHLVSPASDPWDEMGEACKLMQYGIGENWGIFRALQPFPWVLA